MDDQDGRCNFGHFIYTVKKENLIYLLYPAMHSHVLIRIGRNLNKSFSNRIVLKNQNKIDNYQLLLAYYQVRVNAFIIPCLALAESHETHESDVYVITKVEKPYTRQFPLFYFTLFYLLR